ncbi:hypothetical protein C8Q77DRAFT_1095290 [Trametes polyzona]|nr:hypothetical protein C8Q77DRAFT_1095290 [Trametes polyzona]
MSMLLLCVFIIFFVVMDAHRARVLQATLEYLQHLDMYVHATLGARFVCKYYNNIGTLPILFSSILSGTLLA